MIEQIKRLYLQENDIVIVSIPKDESIENAMRKLKDISNQIGIHFYAMIISEGTEFKIMSKVGKIKLKGMLEKSLKED